VARKVKKASRKKITPKKAPVQKGPGKKTNRVRVKKVRQKTRLKPAEVGRFREMLLAKWREILGDVSTIEDEALKKSRLDASGDLSSMPIHMADLGTDNYEQEFALGLLDGERKLLQEISDALQRIEDGTYGICEGTGKPIPKGRLKANPWARYCVEYARRVEQGTAGATSSEFNRPEDDIEYLEEEIEAEEEQDQLIDLDEEKPEDVEEFSDDKDEEEDEQDSEEEDSY
jgi:DnaK suppressor protein